MPPGRFSVGAPDGQAGASPNERPQHVVTFARGYFIGKYEVTAARYASCQAARRCAPSGTAEDDAEGWESNTAESGSGTHPQNGLARARAGSLCEWVVAPLPSVPEWEFAAKGEPHRIYPWGNVPAPDCEHASFNHDGPQDRPRGCQGCSLSGCSGTARRFHAPRGVSRGPARPGG